MLADLPINRLLVSFTSILFWANPKTTTSQRPRGRPKGTSSANRKGIGYRVMVELQPPVRKPTSFHDTQTFKRAFFQITLLSKALSFSHSRWLPGPLQHLAFGVWTGLVRHPRWVVKEQRLAGITRFPGRETDLIRSLRKPVEGFLGFAHSDAGIN